MRPEPELDAVNSSRGPLALKDAESDGGPRLQTPLRRAREDGLGKGMLARRASRLAARVRSSASVCPSRGTTSTTVGLPSVSVPVLSKAIATSRPARSRCSPPLMRIPRRAAAVRPATMLTGVEITNAQGQAITSSTRASYKRRVPVPVEERRGEDEGHEGQAEDDRRVDAREPIHPALRGGPPRTGLPHQQGDARERRVARELRRTDLERGVPVERAREDGIARPLLDGGALSGDGSLVHGARTRDDHPIKRESLAGLDANPCSHRDRIARDILGGTVVAEEVCRLRRQVEQRPDRPTGTT